MTNREGTGTAGLTRHIGGNGEAIPKTEAAAFLQDSALTRIEPGNRVDLAPGETGAGAPRGEMDRIVADEAAAFEFGYPIGRVIIDPNIGVSRRAHAGVMEQREKMKAKFPGGVLQKLAKRPDVGAIRGLLAEAIDEPLHERGLSKIKDVASSTKRSPIHSA